MEISRFHHITQDVDGLSHVDLARDALSAGVRWIQLRMKNSVREEVITVARAVNELCRCYQATLILNDYVDIALEVGVGGVHLGKQDMPVAEARKELGPGMIIGASTNSIEDVERAVADGANYVGVGPYRFTRTKDKLNPILGVSGLAQIVAGCRERGIKIPLIAIGGITLADIHELRAFGVYGVAVASALNKSPTRSETATSFIKCVEAAWGSNGYAANCG